MNICVYVFSVIIWIIVTVACFHYILLYLHVVIYHYTPFNTILQYLNFYLRKCIAILYVHILLYNKYNYYSQVRSREPDNCYWPSESCGCL